MGLLVEKNPNGEKEDVWNSSTEEWREGLSAVTHLLALGCWQLYTI